MIKLGKLKIDPTAIGSQGNAILGIRDSGKTYTATWLAERLHAAGVPFIAFDPIGVWRFLRVPGNGPGIPVVVAGGTDGDLPLTVAGAPEIVRAAMANGISLVIDLFDINLSKADWKRIVTASVRVLLHENSGHGLRHVFIEEAAEFAPQRVGPDQGHVYAEMEKLARMGGNARLGYTLINQRAEEVNKALLELCDNLFLHRQKGRNSLTALSKWLDIGNVAQGKQIIATLPTLPTGECWAWLQGSETPELVNIPAKNSLHPDRRIMRGDDAAPAKAAVDVGSFVKAMRGTLGDIEKEAATVAELRAEVSRLRKAKPEPTGVPEAEVQRRIREAVAAVPRSPITVKHLEALAGSAHTLANGAQNLATIIETMLARVREIEVAPVRQSAPMPDLPKLAREMKPGRAVPVPPAQRVDGVSAPQQRILDVIAQLNAFGIKHPNRLSVAAMAGVSARSSGYGNNLGAMRTAGLIDYPQPGLLVLTDAGRSAAQHCEPPELEEMHRAFVEMLSRPQGAILAALIDAYPDAVNRDDLAEVVGVSAKSSGFGNNLGSLRTLGVLDYPSGGMVRAADFLFPNA